MKVNKNNWEKLCLKVGWYEEYDDGTIGIDVTAVFVTVLLLAVLSIIALAFVLK